MDSEQIKFDRNGIRILPPCAWARGRRVSRKVFSLGLRREIMAKTGGRCRTCLMPLTLKRGQVNIMTVDHHRPRYSGGDNRITNLWPMCVECNGVKGCTVTRKKESRTKHERRANNDTL